MSCQTFRDQFADRLDGRLNGSERVVFESHLAGCTDCHREWEAYANAWQALAHDKGIEPTFGFAARTLRRLSEPRVDARPWWWRPSIRWATLATAVAALVITAWIGRERKIERKDAEIYARVQAGDYLEDYDVIANLDRLKEGGHP